MIDLARRAAAPPPWLAAHTSRLTAADRDVLLVEAESALARVHGFLLIPQLAQTEEYFRAISAGAFPGRDVEAEWDLLSHRQAHRPAGLARLLQVMIDESALNVQAGHPEVMAGQVRHLLALADSPHATVRVIPTGAPIWEKRGCNFDVLSFAGTTDRIGVCHYPIIGAQIAPVTSTTHGLASRAPWRPTWRRAGRSSNTTWLPLKERTHSARGRPGAMALLSDGRLPGTRRRGRPDSFAVLDVVAVLPRPGADSHGVYGARLAAGAAGGALRAGPLTLRAWAM